MPQWIRRESRPRPSNPIDDIETGLCCGKTRQQIIHRRAHRLELLTDDSDAQFDAPFDFHYLGLESLGVIW